MNARTLCLSILNFRDATGYEIRKLSVEGNFSYFVDVSFGAIYPALNRLEEEGLVDCRDEVQPGKPARKVYSITEPGRQALFEALGEMPGPDTYKSPFLLIAMCAEHVDPAHMEAVLDARIAEIAGELGELEAARAECDHAGSSWALDYGISCHRNALDYMRANRDALVAIALGNVSAQAAE